MLNVSVLFAYIHDWLRGEDDSMDALTLSLAKLSDYSMMVSKFPPDSSSEERTLTIPGSGDARTSVPEQYGCPAYPTSSC